MRNEGDKKAKAERQALVQKFFTSFPGKKGIEARVVVLEEGTPVDVGQLATDFGLPADFLAEQLTQRKLIARQTIETDEGLQKIFMRPRKRYHKGGPFSPIEPELDADTVRQNAPVGRIQPLDDPISRWE